MRIIYHLISFESIDVPHFPMVVVTQLGWVSILQATLGETRAPHRPRAAPTAWPCSEAGTAATAAVAAAAMNLGIVIIMKHLQEVS